MDDLADQVERHLSNYTVVEEQVERALALVRREGFHAGATGQPPARSRSRA